MNMDHSLETCWDEISSLGMSWVWGKVSTDFFFFFTKYDWYSSPSNNCQNDISPSLSCIIVGFNHGLPWCVKDMARGTRAPQNPTAKPEVFVATGGPRAMYFTHHGKPWLKPIIARPSEWNMVPTVVTLHKWSQQRRLSTTAIGDGPRLGLAVLGKRRHP